MLIQNFQNCSNHFPKHKPVPIQTLHHFSVLWHITLLYVFCSDVIYFWQKYHVKVHIFKLFSARIKNHQIPHIIFGASSQFFLKLCITLQCHETKLLCTFSSKTLYASDKRSPFCCCFYIYCCCFHKNGFFIFLHWRAAGSLTISLCNILIAITIVTWLCYEKCQITINFTWKCKKCNTQIKCSLKNSQSTMLQIP